MTWQALLSSVIVAALLGVPTPTTPPPAAEPPPCDLNPGHAICEGMEESGPLSEKRLAELADQPVEYDGPGPPPVSIWYIFQAIPDCPPNQPGVQPPGGWADCESSLTFCDSQDPPTNGPYSRVYRQATTADGAAGSWEPLGTTCFPGATPEQSNLTEAMLIEQFHRTDFAPPLLTAQPPDGQTLVNLPTYFEISWGDGFGPGDVDSSTIITFDVRIRPTLEEAIYDYGDGNTSGPTQSLGGPHPTGDITHTYTSGERVTAYATVTYGAEVSVDGDEWFTLPSTTDLTGPDMDLWVRTSTNRLIPNPDD